MTTGNTNEIVVWILVLMLLVTLYFLPTIIAFGSYRAGAIFALNLFLGWTLLGWVGALVWALDENCSPNRDHRTPRRNHGDVGRPSRVFHLL